MIQILYQLSRGNITHTNTLNSAPAEQGTPPQKPNTWCSIQLSLLRGKRQGVFQKSHKPVKVVEHSEQFDRIKQHHIVDILTFVLVNIQYSYVDSLNLEWKSISDLLLKTSHKKQEIWRMHW